jgi:hypothetical protein
LTTGNSRPIGSRLAAGALRSASSAQSGASVLPEAPAVSISASPKLPARKSGLKSKTASAESLLVAEGRILEMVVRGDPLADILDSLCRLVEAQSSGVLASIALLDGDRLRHCAAPSLPKAYTDAINGAAIGPSGGSCGTAAYRGEPVIVEDIATDPLWADYRDLALSHSLRACWSVPVSSQGKVIATFAMYYRKPRRPASSSSMSRLPSM